jgi:hypothetical protein
MGMYARWVLRGGNHRIGSSKVLCMRRDEEQAAETPATKMELQQTGNVQPRLVQLLYMDDLGPHMTQ